MSTCSEDLHLIKYADDIKNSIHISGVLNKKNLKEFNRTTFFHYYSETDDLRFSNLRYLAVCISTFNTEVKSLSFAQSKAQIPAHQQASDWEWDEYA